MSSFVTFLFEKGASTEHVHVLHCPIKILSFLFLTSDRESIEKL